KKEITYSQQLSSLLGGAMRVGPISGSFSMETTISMPEDVDIIVDVETINLIEDKTKDIAEIYRLGFKLIAIRALEDCDDDLLNVLEKNHYYYFERTIEILEGRIVYHPERNLNLYSTKNTPNKIQLNITAIVGKNGSGKSSLIDLLFRMVNNISYASKDWLKTKGLGLIKGLSAELFYVHSGYLYKVIVQDEKIRIQEYLLSGDEFISVPDIGVQEMKKEHFKYLFYTIGINHSQYALNSVEYGDWIRGLFHKNDAYQAPIVLNPMRTKGIVDINKENEFVKSRLLANLLSPVADREDIGLRQITEKQKAIKITFNLQSEKNEILFEREDDTKVPYSKFKDDKAFILKTVADVFNIPADRLAEKSEAVKCAQDYIIRKLVRIAVTYPQYDGYFSKRRIAFLSETKLEDLVKRLKNNSSHVTYKLKQAINYWKYEYWPKTDQFEVDIEAESTRLENFMASVDGKDILEFIPPSIFSSDITLVAEDKIESPFHKLSSGEKQLVYSLSSILYHIKNIDSVNTKDGLIAYSMINIVLDEIELYYHPELQRLFINYLITNIRKLELSEVSALNFCLVTHSPYILSDLTSNYTLKMGEERNSEQMELTFGSNIHDLLANDFFMENGFMGEWAKRKIEEAILFLNFSKLSNQRKAFKKRRLGDLSTPEKFELASIELELKGIMELKLKEEISELEFEETLSKIPFETQDYYKQIINVIGEPLIRIKLKAMYDEEFEQEEIAALDREGKMQRLNELAMELGITLSKNS
ncbi:MAG TPA: AAA family ATPase, partial [Puia sp.]|nr:AAA family ATPase [Puia sp.]